MTSFVPNITDGGSSSLLSEWDIYDRVVNLKLYAADANGVLKDTYVIRSDFEAYYPSMAEAVSSGSISSFLSLGSCIVRKCQHKPSIKVQYKRNTADTSTEIDIYVSNFHMLDKDGNLLAGFNNSTYKLARVDFSMGYFGQFQALFAGLTPSPALLARAGFLDDANPLSSPNAGHGITVMTMSDVEYVQLDKLPPDMSLHIHGWVGNTLASVEEPAAFPDSYMALSLSQEMVAGQPKGGRTSYLDQVYYENVTRRFMKRSAPSALSAAAVKLKSDPLTGALSAADAEAYGVKVYLSDGARKYSQELSDARFPLDADGNAAKLKVKFPRSLTAAGTMNAIANMLGLKGFSHALLDTTGDYFLFRQEEAADVKAMLKGTQLSALYMKTALKTCWGNCLPAVYNITVDALCTIVCPFFCFINPFETLYFSSRYALGGIASYFANFTNANRYEFHVLWQNVSFATTENINESTIVCTGGQGGAGA